MLPFPAAWVRHFGAHVVTAYPQGGGGRFRAYERLRPQPSFANVVERILMSDGDFHTHDIGDTLRLVTAEGEYGAWVKIEGQRQGRLAQRCIGAVFLGDYATALDCVALDPEKFTELERLSLDLLHGSAFGMSRRPRMFQYAPPPGWHGIPSGLSATWYPLDYPQNLTTIVVPAAWPIEGDEATALEVTIARTGGGIVVESSSRDPIVSSQGLRGTHVRATGRRDGIAVSRELVVFLMFPYMYRMRLDTPADDRLPEMRELFRGVAMSFQPLPSPDERRLGQVLGPTAFVDHWVT